MIEICDSHCHLQDRKLKRNLKRIIESARKAGVKCIIVPGYDLSSSLESVDIAEKNENIYSAVGIHPHDAKTYNEDIKNKLINLLKDDKVIALGEIGLDYYRDLSPRKIQRQVFRKQLKIAENEKIPVIIHTRNSIDDALDIVMDFNVSGVFHAFSKDIKTAEKIIDMGFYIGIGGVVTYKNSRISKSVADIPLKRILLETDSPYLTPESHRGQINEPAYTVFILKKIAKEKKLPIEEVAQVTYNNTKKLFIII